MAGTKRLAVVKVTRLPNRLQTAIEAMGISQVEFATRCGVTPSHLNRLVKRGKHEPSMELCMRCAAVSGWKVDFLFPYEIEMVDLKDLADDEVQLERERVGA